MRIRQHCCPEIFFFQKFLQILPCQALGKWQGDSLLQWSPVYSLSQGSDCRKEEHKCSHSGPAHCAPAPSSFTPRASVSVSVLVKLLLVLFRCISSDRSCWRTFHLVHMTCNSTFSPSPSDLPYAGRLRALVVQCMLTWQRYSSKIEASEVRLVHRGTYLLEAEVLQGHQFPSEKWNETW